MASWRTHNTHRRNRTWRLTPRRLYKRLRLVGRAFGSFHFTEGPDVTVEESVCGKCSGGGWMEVFSHRPPAFDVCNVCYNPEGHPCP